MAPTSVIDAGARAARASAPRLARRVVVGGALVLAAVASLGAPESAVAIPPVPGGDLGGIVGAGVDAITGGLGSAAVDGFGALLKALFAWPAQVINRQLLGWLVAVPDYAITPRTARGGSASSNLAELASTTSAMAFAALAAVGTIASVRYWAAGLSGSGSFEAFEALGRMVGAALMIVLWPWLFRHTADLVNAASRGLLGSGSVIDDTSRMLGLAFGAAVSLNFFSIVIACAAGVLFIGLLVCKIVVSASTAVVFVAMPLAMLLWVVPELAWVTRAAMRAFAVVLMIPLAWALCFATFAAVGMDALAIKGGGSLGDQLLMPLVALALLWLTVTLPRSLARMAMLPGGGGAGFAGRATSYMAARRADAALTKTINSVAPATGKGGSSAVSGSGAVAKTAVATAAIAATGGAPAAASGAARAGGAAGVARAGGAAGGVAGAARSSIAGTSGPAQSPRSTSEAGSSSPAAKASGAWTPPPGIARPGTSAGSSSGAGGEARGLTTPPWREIRDRVPLELEAAAARQPSTTPTDVSRAMRALSPAARAGVGELMERNSGQIRGEMAHQAARSDLSDDERDAFRTLAAASVAVRSDGIAALDASQAGAPLVNGPGPMGADNPSEPASSARGPAAGAASASAPPSSPAAPPAGDGPPAPAAGDGWRDAFADRPEGTVPPPPLQQRERDEPA